MNLETQTLTDELKLDIIEKHFDVVQMEVLLAEKKALMHAGKLIDQTFIDLKKLNGKQGS
jgi:hypothetical protein